jgi:hypothetical protein
MQTRMLTPRRFLSLKVRKVSSACRHAVPAPAPERQMCDVVLDDLVCTRSLWDCPSPNAPCFFSFFYFMIVQNSSLFSRFMYRVFSRIFSSLTLLTIFLFNGAQFSTRTKRSIITVCGTYGLRKVITYAPCLGKGAAFGVLTGAGGTHNSMVYISSST